jgi:hypothetical protein
MMNSDQPKRRHRRRTAEPSTFADLLNGFSLDSARLKKRERTPVQPPEPDQAQTDLVLVEPFENTASIVRAYAWTGGRTTSEFPLEIETMVSVRARPRVTVQPEHQEVLGLCGRPRSVAEVAALLKLPLGVAKVLLGDMAGRGLIDVHETATSRGTTPDRGLMARVLSGLRNL